MIPVAVETPDDGSPVSGVLAVFVPLFSLGALLLALSAVPPGRVPWRAIAMPLSFHRSDLAAVGIGTIALALLGLSIVSL